MMHDIILFENLRPPGAFSKTSTLETVFEILRFWCPRTPITRGRKAKTEKKNSVFKISGYMWTGTFYNTILKMKRFHEISY